MLTGTFSVKAIKVLQTKDSVVKDATELRSLLGSIEKTVNKLSDAWESSFSEDVRKSMSDLIKAIRKEQETLEKNLETHLGVIILETGSAEAKNSANAALFK